MLIRWVVEYWLLFEERPLSSGTTSLYRTNSFYRMTLNMGKRPKIPHIKNICSRCFKYFEPEEVADHQKACQWRQCSHCRRNKATGQTYDCLKNLPPQPRKPECKQYRKRFSVRKDRRMQVHEITPLARGKYLWTQFTIVRRNTICPRSNAEIASSRCRLISLSIISKAVNSEDVTTVADQYLRIQCTAVSGGRRDVQDARSPFSEKSFINIYLDASSRYASAVHVRSYGMGITTVVGKSAMGAENLSWRKTSLNINLSAN